MDETVGKDGAELAFEEYLHGTAGFKTVEYTADGEEILSEEISETSPPSYGNTVTLTLSAGMQKAAEDALAEIINEINNRNINEGDPDTLFGRGGSDRLQYRRSSCIRKLSDI